jgi:hypothetical protein
MILCALGMVNSRKLRKKKRSSVVCAHQSSNFMKNRTNFLPSALNGASASGKDIDVARFLVEINLRQNPVHCAEVGKAGIGNWGRVGLGGCFHLLSRPMTRAWQDGIRWILPKGVMVVDKPNRNSTFCPSGEISCFIEPVSNCSLFERGGDVQKYNWFHQDPVRVSELHV